MTSVAERIAALKKKEKSGAPPLIRAKSSKASFSVQKSSPKVSNATVTAGMQQKQPEKDGKEPKELVKELVKERPVDIAADTQKPVSSVKDRIRQLQLHQQQSNAKATALLSKPSDVKPKLKPRPTTKEKGLPSSSQPKLGKVETSVAARKVSLQEAAEESPPIPARPKGIGRAKSARYPDLNTSSKASSGAAISKSKSLGHEASKTLFEKDKAGEQIYNVHVAKKTSKKIAQLAVNIPLPGMAPKIPRRPVVQSAAATKEEEHNGEIKHLSMSRPKMAAGRRRRPRGIKTVARQAVEVEVKQSTLNTKKKKSEKSMGSEELVQGKENAKDKEVKDEEKEKTGKEEPEETADLTTENGVNREDEDDSGVSDEGKNAEAETAAEDIEEKTSQKAAKRARADDDLDGEERGASSRSDEAEDSDVEMSGASVQTDREEVVDTKEQDEEDAMAEDEDKEK